MIEHSTGYFHAPCSYFSQLRIFFYFEPPSLVIAQVPVKHIHFIGSHDIQKFLYFRYGIEMPAYIQHHSPPAKPRLILNIHSGDTGRLPGFSKWNGLQERLYSIENPFRIHCNDLHLSRAYHQDITFISQPVNILFN